MIKVRVYITDAPDVGTGFKQDSWYEGALIFVNSLGDRGPRLPILVSEEDALEVVRQPDKGHVTVQELLTEDFFHIARADCGAGCFCGARIVP